MIGPSDAGWLFYARVNSYVHICSISHRIYAHSFGLLCLVMVTQRTHDVIITSLLHQNDVATSFWRNNDVIIMPRVHLGCLHTYSTPCEIWTWFGMDFFVVILLFVLFEIAWSVYPFFRVVSLPLFRSFRVYTRLFIPLPVMWVNKINSYSTTTNSTGLKYTTCMTVQCQKIGNIFTIPT